MCIKWNIPIMGTPSGEAELEEDKEAELEEYMSSGLCCWVLDLARSLKKYSLNLNHPKLEEPWFRTFRMYLSTHQSGSSSSRLIIIRSFILIFCHYLPTASSPTN